MAEKRPASNSTPGKSSNRPNGWSNLPPQGIQSGPHVGLSYATPTGPQIASTVGITGPATGRSAIAPPAPLDQNGKPLSVSAPRLGYQSGNGLILDGMDSTGKGLSPSGMSPSDEIARNHTTKP
jgi:hypothetical protein